MSTTIEHSKARLAFEADVVAGNVQPRRGMVFRRVYQDDHGLPTRFTCRAYVGDGKWADPTWPSAEEPPFLHPANAVATKGWAFDGVDPAHVETPADIPLFGISPHADLAALAERIEGAEESVRRLRAVLEESPEMAFTTDGGLELSGRLVALFAAAHAEMLYKSGAPNYILMSFRPKSHPGELVLLTIQRSTGKTPAEKWSEVQHQIDAVAAEYRTAKATSRFDVDRAYYQGMGKALTQLGCDPDAPAGQLPSGLHTEDFFPNASNATEEGAPSVPDVASTPPTTAADTAALAQRHQRAQSALQDAIGQGGRILEHATSWEVPHDITTQSTDREPYVDKQTREMVCQGCGGRESFPVPIKLEAVADVLDAFRDRHAGCTPKPPTA